LIIDYKGLVELVYRSGVVANVHADIVCENDDFVYDRGQLVKHQISFREDRGEMYAAYCLVRMKDGTEKCEVLTKREIDSIRARSKASKSGPWVTDYNEMAKKTAFRRVSKWIPLSAEIRDAVVGDDDVIEGDFSKPATPKRLGLEDLTDRLTVQHAEPEQKTLSIGDQLFDSLHDEILAVKSRAKLDELGLKAEANWEEFSTEQRQALLDALSESGAKYPG
jgi:recombination protein RecT